MTNYTYDSSQNNSFVYTEKPKTVKAVQWDGTLAGAQVIDEFLEKAGLDQSDPLNRPPERIEFVRDPTVPAKAILKVYSDRFDMTWTLYPQDYLVTPIAGQAPHSLRKEEFESKYQHSSSEYTNPDEPNVKGPDRDKSIEDLLDKIEKAAKKARPYDTHPYPPSTPNPWIGKRGPYDPVPMFPDPMQPAWPGFPVGPHTWS